MCKREQSYERLLQVIVTVYIIEEIFVIMVKKANEENLSLALLNSENLIQIDNQQIQKQPICILNPVIPELMLLLHNIIQPNKL